MINQYITHKTFGVGKVEELEVDTLANAKIYVQFSPNYGTRSFLIRTLTDFFSDLSVDLRQLSCDAAEEKRLLDEKQRMRMREIANNIKPIEHKVTYEFDEEERELTSEDWRRAYRVAGEQRFLHQQRAVVMDTGVMFINASAALRYMNLSPKSGDKLYAVCERYTKKYLRHSWRYATKSDINRYIEYLESEGK